jgi:hypothetical protein
MALTANVAYQRRNDHSKVVRTYVILTGEKFYKGALVELSPANKARIITNAVSGSFAGMAVAEVASGDGTLTVKVESNFEVRMNLKTVVTVALIMDAMYAYDDADPTSATDRGPQIGTLVEWIATNDGWIALGSPAMANAAS